MARRGIEHGDEMASVGEGPDAILGGVLFDCVVERVPRKQLQNRLENAALWTNVLAPARSERLGRRDTHVVIGAMS